MSLVLNTGLGLGGGSDKHNLGWFTDDAALAEAYPVGNDGDYALVGSTDTIWTWDSDTTAWVDTDRKGQVSSVNNETGDVTIDESDILPSQSGNSGKFLTTNGTSTSWGDALPLSGGTMSGAIETYSINSQDPSVAFSGKAFHINKQVSNNITSKVFVYAYDNNIAMYLYGNNKSDDYKIFDAQNQAGYLNFTYYFDFGRGGGITAILPGKTGIYELGAPDRKWTALYTTKLNNGSDITIPNIAGTMVVADYTGATVGQVLQLDSNSNAVWATVDALPSQSGNAGKILGTDGTNAAWETKTTITFRTWGANE